MKPKLLDLFAGPGGATVGYERAGWDVTGVDLEPWACYPGECVEADAMAVLRGEVAGLEPWQFDAIHASPPCQRYSAMKTSTAYDPEDWPDLLAPTLELLNEIGKPYVVENVPGARGTFGMLLCGSMFDGLKFPRHRYFATGHWNGPILAPHSCNHSLLTKGSPYNYLLKGGVPSHKGAINIGGREYLDGLGLDWVPTSAHNGRRLKGSYEAIPPAYTEWLGTLMMQQLGER